MKAQIVEPQAKSRPSSVCAAAAVAAPSPPPTEMRAHSLGFSGGKPLPTGRGWGGTLN